MHIVGVRDGEWFVCFETLIVIRKSIIMCTVVGLYCQLCKNKKTKNLPKTQ